MFRTKKALLFLTTSGILLATGCFGSGGWWKWALGASQFAYNTTGTLWYTGILTAH